MEKVGIIVTTNQAASVQDMSTIEKVLKEAKNVNRDLIECPHLPQSKSYLKILGLPYYLENTNNPITSELVEGVIKESHIFNDVPLASKSRIIKASSNSDSAVIWIDIWDSQNRTKAKAIINCCFNVGCYIATVCGTNMNPSVPQCKN